MLLVDGNHLSSRNRHAKTKRLTTAHGTPSGVCYGFFNGLAFVRSTLSVLPSQIVVFWDGGRSEVRKSLYPKYKSGRKSENPTPEEIAEERNYYEQLEAINAVLPSLGIRSVKCRGVEADDLISIYAKFYSELGRRVVILTGDHDLWQCANQHVSIFDPKDSLLNFEDIKAKSVLCSCDDIVRLKAMAGDASDAIDGVPKIGDVRARALLPYWNEIFSDQPIVLPETLGKLHKYYLLAREHRDVIFRNEAIVRLPKSWEESFYDLGVVRSVSAQMLTVPTRNTIKFIEFCKRWELNSLLERIDQW